MYKDLSLKEKAKVLQYGGKLGLTSVEDIAKLYDDAIGHTFQTKGQMEVAVSSNHPTLNEYLAQRAAEEQEQYYLEGSRNRTKPYDVKIPVRNEDRQIAKQKLISEQQYLNTLTKGLADNANINISDAKRLLDDNNYPVKWAGEYDFWFNEYNNAKKNIHDFNEVINNDYMSGANCLATATSNNPNPGHFEAGNISFVKNHRDKGYEKVGKEDIKPGGIIQLPNKSGQPGHAVILDHISDGDMYVNYSNGDSIYKKNKKLWDTPTAYYNFVGNSADSVRWTNEYNQLYGTQYSKGGPIVSPYGQWLFNGKKKKEDTIIPSNDITMDYVDYPVLGVSDAGDAKVMMPWNDYKFRGSMVYEHPLVGHSAQEGRKFNKEWKALDNIQYNVYPDTTFTREKTGYGSIEVFDKNNGDTIRYPNGYTIINPYPGENTVYYNPKYNDEQDIRLDALHLMYQDPVYDALNSEYRYWSSGDVEDDAVKFRDMDMKRYGKAYPLGVYIRNQQDALLRNAFIKGDKEYVKSKNYNDVEQLRKDNWFLMPYIDRIHEYLNTGKKPQNLLPEVAITPNEYKKGGHLFQGNLSSYMNDSQLENARGIWNYLVGQKGLTQRNAAAIMGNVMQESGLNPNAKNPKSSAKGYFQMLDSKRKDYDKWIRNNPHSKDYGEFDYYVHLIDDVVDPYMDGYNSFMKRWDDVKKAYEAKPSDKNRQSMQEYQDYYDRMYRQRVENNRLFPVIDFNRAWNNYELPLNEITPLFEETFERAGEGSEHEKRNNYAQDFYDYFYDPDINRQEIFNWENNRHMQNRISPVPADFRLPNRPLVQSAQLPTDIYLNEMMLDMPSYNQLMYREKPQGYFFLNGGIHIDPKNKGTLTETMRRTGKSKYELAHSKNPLTRKRAQFAINASHWHHKHDEGGYLYSEGGFLLAPYLYIE